MVDSGTLYATLEKVGPPCGKAASAARRYIHPAQQRHILPTVGRGSRQRGVGARELGAFGLLVALGQPASVAETFDRFATLRLAGATVFPPGAAAPREFPGAEAAGLSIAGVPIGATVLDAVEQLIGAFAGPGRQALSARLALGFKFVKDAGLPYCQAEVVEEMARRNELLFLPALTGRLGEAGVPAREAPIEEATTLRTGWFEALADILVASQREADKRSADSVPALPAPHPGQPSEGLALEPSAPNVGNTHHVAYNRHARFEANFPSLPSRGASRHAIGPPH